MDWNGGLYAGIDLKWNHKEKWLDALMNGYVSKLRQHFSHKMSKVPQHSPHKAPKKVYGALAQDTIVPYYTAKFNDEQIKLVQQVIGVCLYYDSGVDDSILPVFSTIASEQSNGIK